MQRLETLQDYQNWQRTVMAGFDESVPCLKVCDGTGCRALGSIKVLGSLRTGLSQAGLDTRIEVIGTGCPGFCEQGPLITIYPQRISYQKVSVNDVPDIINRTLIKGEIIDRLIFTDPATGEHIHKEPELPFYEKQKRQILEWNGRIDPKKLEDYVALNGYSALAKVLASMTPDQVIDEVKASGLRGRGGAGFSTGLKWEICRKNVKTVGSGYLVCNADEGDPGAFMNRSVLEGNPHLVIEGMIIGAYAIGVNQGFIYIRSEYPLAVENLRNAIRQAQDLGLLGKNILGSGFDFSLNIRLGAGAFVCGEETSLMASIEGRIGEPRPRPPFPAQSGLWGKPTNINNVESWANVPIIINHGSKAYAEIGTLTSKGTKIFSLVGKINNTGLVEVPMGITLHEIVYDIGGGIPGGKAFKAAQLGGPSGGCVSAAQLDAKIDYESLKELGAIMGSGGMVIADEDTCMVDFARYFMAFTQEESCGKCIPCRLGTKAMLSTLEKICAGRGELSDIDYLIEVGNAVGKSALCALGQTSPNPVLSTLRYFRDEYEAHIIDKRCPAKVCKGLITYNVQAEKCTGCQACARACPSAAIQGSKKTAHVIDDEKCIRCGMCISTCKFDAILVD